MLNNNKQNVAKQNTKTQTSINKLVICLHGLIKAACYQPYRTNKSLLVNKDISVEIASNAFKWMTYD